MTLTITPTEHTPSLDSVRNYVLARYLQAQRCDERCDSLETHWLAEIRYYAGALTALDDLDLHQGIVRDSLGYRAWRILWAGLDALGIRSF